MCAYYEITSILTQIGTYIYTIVFIITLIFIKVCVCGCATFEYPPVYARFGVP